MTRAPLPSPCLTPRRIAALPKEEHAMNEKKAEIERRIAKLEDSRFCASMSDDFAHSNGTIAAIDADIRKARAELDALDEGRTASKGTSH